MKVKTILYDKFSNRMEINWGKIGNVVQGYCNYFSEDPCLIMNEETLKELSYPFTIEMDNISDALIARNVLNGKDLTGDIYTGRYKVYIDNDLSFGVIDVRWNKYLTGEYHAIYST